MKVIELGCLLALAAVVSCIGNDPLLVVPYCLNVENAYLTRDGDYVDFTDITVNVNTGNPIFFNGQDYGLDGNAAFMDAKDRNPSFYGVGKTDGNGTANLFTSKGFTWDFGYCFHRTQNNQYGFGLMDGTLDTVDGAMQFTVNETFHYMSPMTNITCLSDGHFKVDLENPEIPFATEHYYYVPQKPDQSWARVVNTITNPSALPIGAAIGYWNHAGGLVHVIKRTSRFVVISDAADEAAMHDNPFSVHWNGFSAKQNKVKFHADGEPADGVNWVKPYFEVTVPAGKSMTFMLIFAQGNMSQSAITNIASALDGNPLMLFNKMTDNQLNTLQNFNACAAAVPTVNVNVTVECVKPANKASIATDWWLDFPLIVTDSAGKDTTYTSSKFDVPEGKFSVRTRVMNNCDIKLYDGEVKCAPAKSSAAVNLISFAVLCLALLFSF